MWSSYERGKLVFPQCPCKAPTKFGLKSPARGDCPGGLGRRGGPSGSGLVGPGRVGRRHGRPGIFLGCTWCWSFITLWRCMLAWLGAARLEPHLHRVRTWRTFQGKRILPTVWSKVQHGLEP